MLKKKPSTSSKNRRLILLVEDDPIIGPLVEEMLEADGFAVTRATTVQAARAQIEQGSFHLVVLDVNLPDGNGLEYCKELRAEMNSTPVLMLTSLADEDTVVRAFALGANDYLRKPFGKKELLARVKFQTAGKGGVTEMGAIRIDLDKRTADIEGHAIALTPKELQILALLVRRAGEDVSRDTLLAEIDPNAEMDSRTLDSHVSHLRKKLEKAKLAEVRLVGIPKIGYRLEQTGKRKA